MAERGVKVFLALTATFFIVKDVGAAVALYNRWKSDLSKDQTSKKFSQPIFGAEED